jgi:acyl-CoA reductase-like NAD-dependent aldehyde dehydrogenase
VSFRYHCLRRVEVCANRASRNAPYILGVRAFLFAVAAGNTCVLKGPEISPRTYWAIGSILTAAGLPPGVLNIIFHRPSDAAEITTALIEHPAVRKVNFTGSTPVGRIIAATAGRVLKPVVMELGGKASAIVLDDADLEKAATACALGAFLNCGQVCMSTERIVVQSAILEKFTAALKSAVSNIFGEDTPAPVLVASAGVDKNKRLIDDAIKAGAKVLHGDHEVEERHPETKEVSKTRMRPIIVGGVHKEMELYHTESFGPSVSLIEVQTEEEAIQVANDTEYGLSGAVFTESLARGLRVAKQIDSG